LRDKNGTDSRYPQPIKTGSPGNRGSLFCQQSAAVGSSWHVVVSSPQHGEHTAFFSSFPLGGIHGQSILPVIPLGLQKKASTIFYDIA